MHKDIRVVEYITALEEAVEAAAVAMQADDKATEAHEVFRQKMEVVSKFGEAPEEKD